MATKEERYAKEGKRRRKLTVARTGLILVLIVFVALMMVRVEEMQRTARVINYAGLVRGATQRLVKLEINGTAKDDLMEYLDEILSGLKYGEGSYELLKLDNENYQEKLDNLMLYWNNLKKQIVQVRTGGPEQKSVTKLVEMSEIYFELADETVFAAEAHSDKIAKQIRGIEIVSAADMLLLVCMIMEQAIYGVRMRNKNQDLERKAYIDTHTGLKNKNMCEEILERKECIEESTACLMFDINNLKQTNDTLGHTTGDRLIADFARAIRTVLQEKDFAGRCGGDEFMVLLYGVDENTVDDVLERLREEVERFNSLGENTAISYAQGWAVSTDFKDCTFRRLFDEADQCMYANKRKMKEVTSPANK